jgi:hypothetical protein
MLDEGIPVTQIPEIQDSLNEDLKEIIGEVQFNEFKEDLLEIDNQFTQDLEEAFKNFC